MDQTDERFFSESFLRRLESLALQFRSLAKSQLQGERRSARRGHSIEFADFRPYTLGDDFRRIDWNAYARLERLFIKLFIAEEEITLHLLIDNSPSMDWGEPNKLGYAVRAAAAIGYIALVGLDQVTAAALFPSDGRNSESSFARFPPVRGKRSALRMFSFLQSISAVSLDPSSEPAPTPYRGLSAYAAAFSRPGSIVLFSDLMDDSWQTAVSLLRSRGNEITIIQLLAPEEISPSIDGDYRLIDSEGRPEIEISADYQTLQRYQSHLQEWQASWQSYCQSRAIAYIPVSTLLPLEELLFAWLPKQGVLR